MKGVIYVIGIYKITNKLNNKVYIGQSGRVESRLNAHENYAESMKNHNTELYEEMKHYGVENFKFELLEEVDITELEEKHIQEHIAKGCDLYNKILFPTNNKGVNNPCSKFNQEQVDEIIALLKENKISNIAIAKHFNCSPATIDRINNGDGYIVEGEQYPIRVFKKSQGENNAFSLLTNDEVIEIRKRYVGETGREIYNDYRDKYKSYTSFERVLLGKTYSELPIYKKREKKWINTD